MRRQFIISCIVLWLFAGHAAAADPLADSTPAEIASQISKLRTEIESFSAQEAQHLLLNPDFEIQVDGQIAGWQYEPAPGAVVQTDSVYAHHGTQSMHLESRSHVDWAGPIVSLRSKPFQLPPTRRLAVTAWLRVDPQAPTPSVWLVLEGSYLGQPFAHQLKVGSGQQAVGLPPLSGDWMPVTLQLDELPPEGITDVRVGVDLRGTGDVWVDHMHIDTMWLAEDERQRLISAVASAEVEIKANKLASAQRIVESGIKAELTRLAATDQIAPSLRAVSNALEKAVETQS